VNDEFFEVRADISPASVVEGDGVYTVLVFADVGEDSFLVSTYPIFVGDETFRYP
jgi:coenzyme F420-reducing hydrogenase beta subunit